MATEGASTVPPAAPPTEENDGHAAPKPDGHNTGETKPEEAAGDGENDVPQSRRIVRSANSRRLVRRKTKEIPSPPKDPSPTSDTSPSKTMEDPPSTSSDASSREPEVPKLSRSGSDVSMGSCNSEDGINDSVTNMGELGSSVYSFLGHAASTTWGWVKAASSHAAHLWNGDTVPPEEWHCDTASEESDLDNDNEDHRKPLEEKVDNTDLRLPKVRDKTFHICNELMTTEESYVRKLGILCMAKERASKIVLPDMTKTMFQNVEVIHQFHKENLLPQLKDRIDSWDSNPRIGDIMKKLVPFLKLYTEYVKNFEKGVQLVDSTEQKSSSFASLLKEIKNNDQGGRLRIQAHMLEPIQRVPRYELLLRDYLKRLPDNSTDRPDTEKAMQLVSEAASHFENMMKRDTRIMQLMQIQNELDGPVNVVGAKRELVKRGKIQKVSARTGKTSDKYAFLFSDMMLLCSEQSLAGLSSGHYKVRHIFELENAQVTSGNNLAVPNTFYIKSKKHAVEMATKTAAERDEWVAAIEAQMRNSTKGKLLRHGSRRTNQANRSSTVGLVAPVFVRMNDVSMCMLCATNFSALRRKQHCASCGSVVCSKCSSKQMHLDYDPSRQQRVCDECFVTATEGVEQPSKRASKVKTLGTCLERAHLLLSHDAGKSWKATYLALYNSKMLYSFKAPQDIIPVTSVALHASSSSLVTFTIQQVPRKVLQIKVAGKVYHIDHETDDELIVKWQKIIAEMEEVSSRNSVASVDSISLDSFSLDSQSIASNSSLDTTDSHSITSKDSGVHMD